MLDGNYADDTSGRLVSPAFLVPPGDQNPRLRLWQWYSINGHDFVEVQIKVGTNNWQSLATYTATSSGVWSRPSLDLSAYAEQTVQIGFYFESHGYAAGMNYYTDVSSGWYLDEVTLVTGPVQTLEANVPESFEGGLADWSVDGGTWEIGVPTSGPSAAHSGTNCAATVLGGNYADDTSGRLASPAFLVPPGDQNPRLRFWQWYSINGHDFVEVQIKAGTNNWQSLATYTASSSGVWSRPSLDLSAYAGQTVQLGFYFESHGYAAGFNYYTDVSSGWYLDDVTIRTGPDIFNNPEMFESGWGDWDTDNYTLWQIGRPESGPPTNGFGERAYSFTNCAATLLSANYSANSEGRLITPTFIVPSVSGDARVILRFRQWYQYGTGDAGLVQISAPYDTNWNTLAVAATNGTSGTWTLATVDMTQFQGQEVHVAFYHTADGDGSIGAGWFIDDVSLSQATPTRLPLNALSNHQFTTNRQNQYFVVTAPPGGHLRIQLNDADHLGINELYMRRGALPTAGGYDYRFPVSGADQSIFVPNAGAGDWFILAYNDSGPVPGTYSLYVDFTAGVILDSLSPTKVGSSMPSSVTINGAGFAASDAVALVNGGSVYPASNVFFVSASQLIADFNFPAIPTNNYQLRVTGSTNSDSLPFELIAGAGPKLETKLQVPSRVGYHAIATIYVEYKNSGDAPMPAPLLTVSASQNGRQAALLTLDSSRLVQGFWTDAIPEGFANAVQFLANGATPGLLQPGESRTVPVYYAGWQQPWDGAYNLIYFNLGILEATNTTPIVWDALKADMRPGSVSTQAWDVIFANLTNQTGGTWGDYVRMLNDNATYLAKLGQNVNDIRDLLGFETLQASGLSITRMLASAVDAQMQAPGPALVFTRSFSTDISQHFALGRFGRGWSDNWERSLTLAADGTVTIFGPGGSRRVFQPDSRYPTYFAQAGDHATLTSIGGGAFTLRETDGTLSAFRADGRLDYVQDPHTNRITATWSGNLLTRLDHSSGLFLQLAYSGSRVASITDSLNRQTTFTYDGSGEHLASAQNYRGELTTYSYVLTPGSPSRHALMQVINPGGVTQNYTYDARGRLASRAGCCGAIEQVNYSYDSAGMIAATDALTNTTKSYFDHRALLVRNEDPLGNVTQRTYDANGLLTKVTDAAGRTRAFAYDERGNRISDTDQLGFTTRFAYTSDFNKLATLVDAKGNMTRYGYEPDNDLASITYADNSSERWGYDALGNRLSWTNRRGQPILYTNDTSGRVIARRYPDNSLVTFRYDARGNLTNFADVTGTTAQDFDSNDRLTKITYPGGQWLRYTYDAAGRRASMEDQFGHRTDYHYDSRGRLESLTDEASKEIVHYSYDAVGRLATKTLGNGVYTTYTYDAAGQVVDLFNHKTNGAVLSRFQYTYDKLGRRATMTTTYGAGDSRAGIAGVWQYDYDDSGQLVGWTAPGGRRVDYSYDALGNRLNVRDNGTNTTYAVNILNQYTQVGSTTYQYDADGNVTNRVAPPGTSSFSWSSDSKLISAALTNVVLQNFYDAAGRRTRTTDNGTSREYVIDPLGLGAVVGEYVQGSSIPSARYQHGIGLVSKIDAPGNPAFYDFDSLGSTSELVANSDSISNAYAYLPFGELLYAQQVVTDTFQFVGELGVMADRSNLAFMRARHYDASLGRFMSSDPIGLAAGDVNFYRYVANSPVAHSDPSGLDTWIRDCRLYPEICATAATQCPDLTGCTGSVICKDAPGTVLDCLYCQCHHSMDDPNNGYPPEHCRFFPEDCKPGGPTQPSAPTDPNSKVGPMGFSNAHFVSRDSLLPYTINFENETNATAPAQQVFITDPLTNTLDWQTFELTEIAFGDHFIAVPPKTQHFEKTEKLRFNGVDFELQIEAGIHLANGQVYATLRSLNPTNGLPPPVDIGFLPPENGTGRGQGHIGYTIRALTNLPTGTEIRNVANITFDYNPPIGTDWVDPHNPAAGIDTNKQALVTIDANPPSSNVTGPSGTATNAAFTVTWLGTDVGSGIVSFDTYVRTNSGPWTLWLPGATANSAMFFGQNGKTYGFYSVAHDGAGNVETNAATADVSVTTQPNYPPVVSPVANQTIIVGQPFVFTNSAYDPDGPITFSLGSTVPAGASITTNGVFDWTPKCAQGSTTNTITVWATDSGTPPQSNSMTFSVIVPECIEASVGNTVMLAGSTSSVPVRLLSTTALTNMVFTVAYPAERLTNFTLTVNSPQVVTQQLQLLGSGQVQVAFTLPASSVLYGPTNVGQLGFTAISNQHSAFVPLTISGVTGLKPDGSPVGSFFGLPGRVVVVGPEPLLEAWLETNSQRMMTLYGKPGSSYGIEGRTNLVALDWQPGTRLPMTNLALAFAGAGGTNATQFYRAYEFFADPPILEIRPQTGTNPLLLFYGMAGTNYTIQATTNLVVTNAWMAATNFALTNSFRFIGVGNLTNKAMYFRAKRP